MKCCLTYCRRHSKKNGATMTSMQKFLALFFVMRCEFSTSRSNVRRSGGNCCLSVLETMCVERFISFVYMHCSWN